MVGIRTSAAGLVAVLAASSVGCRRPPTDSPPSELRVAMAREVHGLDPHRQTAHRGLSVVSNLYESLTALDEEMRVVPGLAVRWESPDELTWRFHLRPRVFFHDGRPLTPSAVVNSLARARLPGRSPEGGLASVRDVTAPAADVVEIRTARPSLMLLNDLATAFIVPEDAPEEITSPIGTGPYRFVRFQPQAGLELAAWDGYWNGRPPISRLSFAFEPDPDRRQEMLASATADVALRLAETASEKTGAGYHVVWRAAPGTRVLGLRVDRPPFSDPRLRRAVSLAIDREGFTRTSLAGRALAVGQFLPRGIFGYVPDLVAPSRDVEEARRRTRSAMAIRRSMP